MKKTTWSFNEVYERSTNLPPSLKKRVSPDYYNIYSQAGSSGLPSKIGIVYDQNKACLVAAAPEMYEMLLKFEEKTRGTISTKDLNLEINALLKKARGES